MTYENEAMREALFSFQCVTNIITSIRSCIVFANRNYRDFEICDVVLQKYLNFVPSPDNGPHSLNAVYLKLYQKVS